jgi:protein-S-isoprenylcysteine O-methyltransferase Ste14
MPDILLQAFVLIWVPLVPLRLVLHGGISLWRKFGDFFYVVAFVYWAAAAILLVASKDAWLGPRFAAFPGSSFLGWTLAGFGLLFGLWAANTLGLVAFFTRPQVSPRKSTSALIVTGPYRWVRHPFYLSEWFLLLGVALVSQSWAILGLVLATLLVDPLITQWEEKELVARLGKDYLDYQKKVPRFLPCRLMT